MRLRLIALLGTVTVAGSYLLERTRLRQTQGAEAERRGRHAATPLEMTQLGWSDVLARSWTEALDDRVFSVAAGVAFYALLSIVPGLSALISIYGLFTSPAEIATQLGPFLALLPDAAQVLVEEQAVRIAAKPSATLSLTLVASLAVALWSANAAIKAIFDALNVIYDEREKRSFLHFNLVSLGVTLSAIILLTVLLFLIAVAPGLIRLLPYAPVLEAMVIYLRWPVMFLMITLSLAILYLIGPSRRAPRFIWLLPGALAAALLWVAASGGFSWYVSTLGDYAATYGSLATVVVFMTWLWLSSSIILMGAELNAELEHQTARDTTIGQPKPLGMRGAVMADNVGPATVARGD
jgi:membrane protein